MAPAEHTVSEAHPGAAGVRALPEHIPADNLRLLQCRAADLQAVAGRPIQVAAVPDAVPIPEAVPVPAVILPAAVPAAAAPAVADIREAAVDIPEAAADPAAAVIPEAAADMVAAADNHILKLCQQ